MPLTRFEECSASSDGISTWTPLKPQHSNPNPNPLPINSAVLTSLLLQTSYHPSQTPCFPWISYATQKLMLDSCKILQKQYESFHTFLWHFFSTLEQNFIAYCSSKVSDCIFENHQMWQSGFSWVYFNSCYSCSFEADIIRIGQSCYKMYSNNTLNFSRVYDNFKCPYKKSLET